MTKPSIELISFNLCPFVQRSIITLKKKGIDFKITYIDLANKPEWFLNISPLGKVPVVRYGHDVLFESAVINEFLDEITPESLMPSDPLEKAKERGWIEYSSQVITSQHLMSVSDDQGDYQQHRHAFIERLSTLENIITSEGFFNGNGFSLIDSALAPIFTRLRIIEDRFNLKLLANFPKLAALSARYLNLDYVKNSVVEEFEDIYIKYLIDKNSFLAH